MKRTMPVSLRRTADPLRVLVMAPPSRMKEVVTDLLLVDTAGIRMELVVDEDEGLSAFMDWHHDAVLLLLHRQCESANLLFDAIRRLCFRQRWRLPEFFFCDTPGQVAEAAARIPQRARKARV